MKRPEHFIPEQRPFIPLSEMEIFLEMSAWVGIFCHGLILVKWWAILPLTVPTHFGASGAPDAWGNKATLFLLPTMAVGMYFMMTLLSRFPNIYNYPWQITPQNYVIQYYLARALLAWIKTEIIWIFAWINYRTILTAVGDVSGLGTTFIYAFLLVLLATVANYFFQSYQSR